MGGNLEGIQNAPLKTTLKFAFLPDMKVASRCFWTAHRLSHVVSDSDRHFQEKHVQKVVTYGPRSCPRVLICPRVRPFDEGKQGLPMMCGFPLTRAATHT